MRCEVRSRFFKANDCAVVEQTLITLLGDQREGFGERELFRKRDIEGDEHFTVGRVS